MLEIPNLNKIYEDETGELWLFDLEGNISLHAFVIPTTDRKVLQHYMDIILVLKEELKEKGLEVLKTYVQTDEQYRYAMFFGFVPTGMEVTGLNTLSPVYELEMDLT